MTLLNININGNKKLINNSKVRFMIWNLPSVITCPYATEHCKGSCYATKAERVYPQVKPSRRKNFEESRKDDFVANMIYTIETYARRKSFKGKKIVFRIHESGDFYNKVYAMSWLKIASHFDNSDIDIVFMAYTKSLAYFKGEAIPGCMVIRSSVWDDTKEESLELTKEMDLPIYTAFTKEDMAIALENGYTKCDCKDCANCGKCWDKSIKKLACEIH